MRRTERGLALTVESLQWGFDRREAPFLVLPRLALEAGCSLAVTGPSGSGKTSLLALLSGMDTPQRGTIRWGDTDLGSLGESGRDAWRRANVGLVFQDFRLVEDLSVIENVLLPASFSRWRPGPGTTGRAHELLSRLGLSSPGQRVGTLSRGEMQRTALARALLFRPRLLVADEPTASLDRDNERLVGDVLFAAAREDGATLLIATHQKELQERADRVLALDHGREASS